MIKPLIKPLTLEHLDAMFAIWKDGTFQNFPGGEKRFNENALLYREIFGKRINEQDVNFKIWGYFENDELLGWQSILPCQPAPFVAKYYGESSTYVKAGVHGRGIARQLITHAIDYARKNSQLMYVIAYISEKNDKIHPLATEVGFQRIGALPRSPKDNVLPDFAFWILPL